MIFAAPRCSELPELGRMRDIFEKKYGKDFVSAAVDLRPDAAVNNLVSMDEFSIHIQPITDLYILPMFALLHSELDPPFEAD